jgi:serine/threonine protein kinase
MAMQKIAHYSIREKIGEGGMGVVYRAEDEKLRRVVALKLLSEELARDPRSVIRFQREARLASSISHPHICTIFDVGEYDGRQFIAMELLEGQTLQQEIGGRPLALHRLIEWAIQIADALDAAHRRGVVHRDIKSANVFITKRGQVKIMDFGLAKHTPQAVQAMTGELGSGLVVSSPGTAIGTITHMSPEQVSGKELDGRSDLFSFGVLLFEMSTGSLPFKGENALTLLNNIVLNPHTSAVQLNPQLPAELDRILNKALEKELDLRYQSALDLRADLTRFKRDSLSGVVPLSSRSAAVPITPDQQALSRTAVPDKTGSLEVIEPWEAIVRDGRRFATAGSGLMYWFRSPLGDICFPDGFRNFLQPALENPRVSGIRFVLDHSIAVIVPVWKKMILPQIQTWIKRSKRNLELEDGPEGGRFMNPDSGDTFIGWVFADLGKEFNPCFKIFVDDLASETSGELDGQIFLATAGRCTKLGDGTQYIIQIPDTILHARFPKDEKVLKALSRLARQWDFMFG